jgi:hypothetical protein
VEQASAAVEIGMLCRGLPPFIPVILLNLNTSSQNQKDCATIPKTVLNWPINVAICTILGTNLENFFSRPIISADAFKFPPQLQTPLFSQLVLIAGGLKTPANGVI